MTTFDRYILHRFLHVYSIGFIALYGLFVVIDGFSNVDSFQENGEVSDNVAIIVNMAVHYVYQATLFFNMIGLQLGVVAVMVVFSQILKNSELYPILSAGVPTYRLIVPCIYGALIINAMMIVNQEIVIPRIAGKLQAPRGEDESFVQEVKPVYDRKTRIYITGQELYLSDQKIQGAVFGLPVPNITNTFTTLSADEAVFVAESAQQSSGWLLKNPTPSFDELELTETGRTIVLPRNDAQDVFVVTGVSFDELDSQATNYRLLSTARLTRRIKNPSTGLVTIRGQMLHLHDRMTQPLMNLAAILVALPLVVRKEGSGIVMNFAICTGVMALYLGVQLATFYLGKVNVVSADLAAWLPVIICGTATAWLSGSVQT